MDKFLKEIQTGEIHFRDRWQFELKSEFAPLPTASKNIHTQEFFIFVPNALIVNSQTYTADDFFKDQTNFIRYKTPIFTFDELLDLKNQDSPLKHLSNYKNKPKELEEELKLFANVVRSALREEVHKIILSLLLSRNAEQCDKINQSIFQLCQKWRQLRHLFRDFMHHLPYPEQSETAITTAYIDEFLSSTADYYFIWLLKHLRNREEASLTSSDALICSVLNEEKEIRIKYFPPYATPEKNSKADSEVLYRQSLLNKFVIDVLHLIASRDALMNRHRNIIGSIAAGIAMLVFLILYTSQTLLFVQSSEPYIFLTIIFYILKDRIKEGLRSIPSIRGFGWLANYKTEIRSPDNSKLLGGLMELFTFVDSDAVDPEIMKIRHHQFHSTLETFQRPEKIMYYKNSVSLYSHLYRNRSVLTTISRFNIHPFVSKAGDPYQPYSFLDTKSNKIVEIELPKTYHINIILKNTVVQSDLSTKVSLEKYRLIIDKNGIKEVQHLP